MDAEEILKNATEAFAAGDFQKAYELWTEALTHVDDSAHVAIHTNRGASMVRLGKYEEALDVYRQVLEMDPDRIEAWQNTGLALKALSRFQEALDTFDSALKIRDDYYPAIRGRIDVLQSLSRFEEAIESAKEAVKLRPDEADVLSNLAFAYLKAGNLNEAIDTYESAIAKGDDSEETKKLYSSVLSQKAVELDKNGDLAAAESLYDKAIELDASESKLFNRAYLYLRTDRADLAQTEFLKVTEVNNQHGAAWSALGILMLQSEDFENAVSYLTKAALYKTDSEDVVYNLGFALYKLGRLDEAVPHFKKALELSPEMVSAQKALEQIEKSLEKKEKLSKMMEQAQASIAQDKSANPSPTSSPPPERATAPGPVAGAQAATPAAAQPAAAQPAAAQPAAAAPVKDDKVSSMASVPVAIDDNVISSMTPDQLAKARSASPTSYFLARNDSTSDGYWGLQYPADALKAPGPYPEDIPTNIREAFLSAAEFKSIFNQTKQEFYKMPKWKRSNVKKDKGLF